MLGFAALFAEFSLSNANDCGAVADGFAVAGAVAGCAAGDDDGGDGAADGRVAEHFEDWGADSGGVDE